MAATGFRDLPSAKVLKVLPMVMAARLSPAEDEEAARLSAAFAGTEGYHPVRDPNSLQDKQDQVRTYPGQEPGSARMSALHNQIPVIDFGSSKEDLMTSVKNACEFGFFQVINHGTPSKLIQEVTTKAEQFFSLRAEGKNWLTDGREWAWRDTLKIACAPASAIPNDHWPAYPAGFKEILHEYISHQQEFARRLLEAISESLGLEKKYIMAECSNPRGLLAINLYPPCPNPLSRMGIREHSDVGTITVLSQNEVPGLQVFKDGQWVDVEPLHDALVVNLGDHMQILSNGRYPSCVHRVLSHKTQIRISAALFLSPSAAAHVRTAPTLIDDKHPALYREFVYGDFLADFYTKSV